MLPRHARYVLSRLRCNGHSLLLGSYHSRIGRIENPSCSACGHSSQNISDLILHCPATDSLRRSLFGDSLSLYNLWSRPWGVARLLGLHGLPPCPHPSEGVGKATTTTNQLFDATINVLVNASMNGPEHLNKVVLEVAQKWIKPKDRWRVTVRALKTVESPDDEKDINAISDEHELFNQVEIEKLVL